jgi:hypothetical protein
MKTSYTPFRLAAFSRTAILLCLLAFSATAQDKDWRPIDPADLKSDKPLVEADADAEAIFWEVRVDDSAVEELAMNHYVRIKVYTEKGKQDFARHDVPFVKGTRIKDFEARVTKPDGTFVLIDKKDILEREIVRANGVKVKAKTVAFPQMEVGSIVEYKYRSVITDAEANMRLVFQNDVPTRRIAYYVKPFAGDRAMAFLPFNIPAGFKPEKDKGGYTRFEMTNVPAFREEPLMLPEYQLKPWAYIYYVREFPKNVDKYWQDLSKSFYGLSKDILKANDDVKAATAQAIQGASTDEEKLRKIYQFCKTQIKNVSYDETATEADKKQASKNKSAGDTLKHKLGAAGDIDQLFGAMARAAGFDARLAFSGDRSELFFDRNTPNFRLMLGSSSIAVKVGNGWKFYSPASYYTPFGMLNWAEEGQGAMVTDEKELIFLETPMSEATTSLEKRTGEFALSEDGTLTGEGRIEFSGHQAGYHKRVNAGESASEKEAKFKAYIRGIISGQTEVTSFTIENENDPEKPFVYTFKIKVPGYAQRTGKRLFFQPNVYEKASQPRFTANTRRSDIYLSYPYAEYDMIKISMPDGFSLENAGAPAPIKDSQGIGSWACQIGLTSGKKVLVYQRDFSFGNGGFVRFPKSSYSALKNMFEAFNRNDVHQLTLRMDDAPAMTK